MLFWNFPKEAIAIWKSLLASLAKHAGGNDIESFVQSLPANENQTWIRQRLKTAMQDLLLADVNLDITMDIVHFEGGSLTAQEQKILLKEMIGLVRKNQPRSSTPYTAEYMMERQYSGMHKYEHTTFLFRAGEKWAARFQRYLRDLIARRWQEGNLSLNFLSFPSSTGAEAYSIAAVIEYALMQQYRRLGLPKEGLDDWMAKWNVRVRAPDIALGPLFKTGRGVYDIESHFRDKKEMRPFAKYLKHGFLPVPGENSLVRANERLRSYVIPEYGDVDSPVDRKAICAGPLDGAFFNNLGPYVGAPTMQAIDASLSDGFAHCDQTFFVQEFRPQIIYSRESLKHADLVAANPRLQWLQDALKTNAPNYAGRVRHYLASLKSFRAAHGKRSSPGIDAAEQFLQWNHTRDFDFIPQQIPGEFWSFDFIRRQIAEELMKAGAADLTFQDRHDLRILLDLDVPASPEMDSLESADITRMDGPTLVYWYGRLAVLQQQKTGGNKIKILEELSRRILDAVAANKISRHVYEMYFFPSRPRFSTITVLVPYFPSLFYIVADSFDSYTVHGTGWGLSEDIVAAKKHPEKLLTVAICAGPGAGQTTNAAELEKDLKQKGYRVAKFSTDDYLKAKDERNAQGMLWGQEDSYHWNKLRADVAEWQKGRPFTPPGPTAKPQRSIDPKELDVLIVEGQYALMRDELRDMLDIRIFIDEFDALRYRQLVDRDISQRGYMEEDAMWKFIVSQSLEFGAATRNMIDFANVIVRPLERKLWTKNGFFALQNLESHRRIQTMVSGSL